LARIDEDLVEFEGYLVVHFEQKVFQGHLLVFTLESLARGLKNFQARSDLVEMHQL
jgi:hypothetical protein